MKNIRKNHTHPVVWLDPGHDSRWDNPSPVVPEYFEGKQMWELALLLKNALQNRGILVHMTKAAVDQKVALVDRGKMSAGADLFISLHSNAAATAQPDWVLVLHQVDNGKDVHTASREVGKLLAQTAATVMGVEYQLTAIKSSSDRDGNGLADDYYGVLRGAQTAGTPGLIIEHGFHTNEKCARWLLEKGNLERLATAEADALAEWFGAAQMEEVWYRVRRSWEDSASQIGAYRIKENAIAGCPEGYTVYDGTGTAIFGCGNGFEEFVREVQEATGASVDGIPGPETLSKTPTVSQWKNNRHPVVRSLQKRLYDLGYHQVGDADGVAGPMFEAAVKAYQKDHGCVVDGEVTAAHGTWKSLLMLGGG